jgi:propionyl-CoA synthetase
MFGWVVSSFTTIFGNYGRFGTSIIFEGRPDLPHAGIVWELIEKYKVKNLTTTQSNLMMIRDVDEKGEQIGKYDISSLRSIQLAGEKL